MTEPNEQPVNGELDHESKNDKLTTQMALIEVDTREFYEAEQKKS